MKKGNFSRNTGIRVLVVSASALSNGPKALKRLLQTIAYPHLFRSYEEGVRRRKYFRLPRLLFDGHPEDVGGDRDKAGL
jgi:hypothetical protein